MPYTKGTVTSYEDLVQKIVVWATDVKIHGADAWELLRSGSYPRGTILKGHGWREGEHFYAGFMPRQIIQGETYRDWLLSRETIAKYFVGYKTEFNITKSGYSWKAGEDWHSYTFLNPDIFTKSANVLFFNTFKQYSDGLEWYEQPGAFLPGKMPLFPLFVTSDLWNGVSSVPAPMMPGIGCPAFGMGLDEEKIGVMDYWITKDRHRMIIALRNYDVWEVAYLGFIEPYQAKNQYAWPAAIIGATSGAIQTGQSVYFGGSAFPTAVTGIKFDYTQDNWSLIRGIPTMVGVAGDGPEYVSNAVINLPDGQYSSFASFVQGICTLPKVSGNQVVAYYFPYEYPKRAQIVRNIIRPTYSDIANTLHTYGQAEGITQYQLEPVEFVQDQDDSRNLFGKLWRIYWPSVRPDRFGEIMVDGKLHLAVPNGWEERDFWLHHGYDEIWQPQALLDLQRQIKHMNKQMCCLIRLED